MFMAAPVVFLGTLGVAAMALWGVTRFGSSEADGSAVTIEFSGACVERAGPMLLARAEQIGMPATITGSTMAATLPNMENAQTAVPQLLIRSGTFTLLSETGEAVFNNDHIDDVAIDLDNAGMPNTLVKLDAGARSDLLSMDDSATLTPMVDGTQYPSTTVNHLKEDPVLTLHVGEGRTSERMKRAADLAIILAHGPLPCPLEIIGVAETENPG
jgi:preprotein translocase subunit SecD